MSSATPAPEPLSVRAYTHLQQRILRGELASGESIDRRAVAAELGISLAPVTEAVGRLQSRGFVEIAARRGTRVRIVRPADLGEQLVLRLALECEVARMVCGDPVRGARDRLAPLAKEADQGAARGPLAWDSENAFHAALAELTGVAALQRALSENLQMVRFMAIQMLVGRREMPRDHERLLKRLQGAHPDEAAAAMRKHIMRGREDILGAINKEMP